MNLKRLLSPRDKDWLRPSATTSLSEVHSTIAVPAGAGFLRKMLAFAGPGFLVSVGYMDPGNWATDLAGGSRFGYALLFVILLSNLIAILMQHLSVKLGVATGRDLAQACRDAFPRPVSFALWILCELAIAACDLAEIIGSAIALKLLFGLPLLAGCLIMAFDVLVILYLQNKGFRALEIFVFTLIFVISACFLAQILFSRPEIAAVMKGFLPTSRIALDPEMLYIAIGIIGATVMPHNLYLHSSIIQTRKFREGEDGKREAIRFGTLDSTVALMFALLVNAAILILAAAAFYRNGLNEVAEIEEAYRLLSPVLGVGIASTLFAVALLASGQNATLTGTLAGQIVMEGFLNLRLAPWLRRLITRAIALVPAVVVIGLYGEGKAGELLVASQVVLSLQLGFAIIPLLMFTGSRKKMGVFVNPFWIKVLGWSSAVLIVALNVKFLVDFFRS